MDDLTYQLLLMLIQFFLILASLGMMFRFVKGWKVKAGRIVLVPMLCAAFLQSTQLNLSFEPFKYMSLLLALAVALMIVWLCWNTATTAESLETPS